MLFARLPQQYRREGCIRNYQTYPKIPSLPVCIAEISDVWVHTSTPPYVFILCTQITLPSLYVICTQ